MKRIIATIVICILMTSMLVGCQEQTVNNNQTDDKPDPTPELNNNQTDDKTDPTPELKVGTDVGDLFDDITLETLDGGTVSTADLRGKIVVINVWATRCPPCKAELPDFDRVATEYEGEVVIIAAHEDYTRSAAPSYVETNFPGSKIIFAYDTPYGDAYYAAGGEEYIPQTAIIDKNGVILYSDSGPLSHDTLVSIIEGAK